MLKFIFNSAFLLLFSAVTVTPLFTMDFKGEISQENRRLMARPTFPGIHADSTQLRSFTLNVESWLNDRIGFRTYFTALHSIFNIKILKSAPPKPIMLGKDGHVFMNNSNDSALFSLSKGVLGVPELKQDRVDSLVQQISNLKSTVSAYGVPVALVTIPQKHILDYDKLPFFISHFVTRDIIERPPDLRVAEALPPDSVKFVFPIAEARLENDIDRLYPQKNFHWQQGRYTKLMASKVAEAFGVAPYEAPGLDEFEKCDTKSDLSHLAGFTMTNKDFLCYKKDIHSGLGIKPLSVRGKYPQIIKHLMTDKPHLYLFHNQNNTNGPKILWMGDSFSGFLGLDLARYFGEVLCFDARQHTGWARGQNLNIKEQVKGLLAVYKPDYIVLSRHDIDHLAEHVMDITPQN